MLPQNLTAFLCFIILLVPLLQAIYLLSFPVKRPAIGAVVLSMLAAILSAVLLVQVIVAGGIKLNLEWFTLANNPFYIGLWINLPATVLIFLVCLIGFLVQLFSTGYMQDDRRLRQYFGYLGLFSFSMLGIVMANNLLLIFCFWEGVGLSSYLLIGFWRHKPRAANAAKKAFLVNRVGDAGFLMAIAILYTAFGTLNIPELIRAMPDSTIQANVWQITTGLGAVQLPAVMLFLAGIGLAMGAIGKSAQFPLQVWLPDAMQGPTPVSALLHAATMVAAGVFLLVRVFPLLSPEVLALVAVVGALTAFMGAFTAFTQHDIKRVLAFSTISQLGYMFIGIGTGSPEAGFFHLTTHAFYKAGLFLSAGAIIYALHQAQHGTKQEFDAQDMRNMGGLKKKMPFTFLAYLCCMLALAGLPFFSGFLSKDAILTQALGWAEISRQQWGILVWLVPIGGFATALMTAIYMGRQMYFVFFGVPKLPGLAYKNLKEVGWPMRMPLLVLALFSLALPFSYTIIGNQQAWLLHAWEAGVLAIPGSGESYQAANWLYSVQQAAESFHLLTAWLSFGLTVTGLVLAYYIYHLFNGRGEFYTTAFNFRQRYARLSHNNWYLDPLYEVTFIKLGNWLAALTKWIDAQILDWIIDVFGMATVVLSHILAWLDRWLVDGLINFGVWTVGRSGQIVRNMQSGQVQSYLIILSGAVLILLLWWVV